MGPGLVPLEPLEHSVLVASLEESEVSVTDVTEGRYGSPAVMPTTSAGSSNGTVVGGRPINVAIAPAETDPRSGRISDDFGGVAAEQ